MRKFYFLLFTLLITTISFSQTSDLFISMYAEGSSNNKFIEIYNGTGSSVDLSDYMIRGSNNGADWKPERDLPLTGTLADGEVYVIAADAADATILAQADLALAFESPVHYNGDDAIAIFKDDGSGAFVVLDVIGIPTEDPGAAWDVAGISNGTQNHTLTRKTTVCDPNSNWATSAGTDASNSEWIVTDSNSEWGNLGSYTGCITTPFVTITSPSDFEVLASGTTSVDIEFTTANTDAGDTVDITVVVDGGTPTVSTNVTSPFTITPTADGESYIVTTDLIRGGASIDFETIDFSIAFPCDLQIGTITTACNAFTSGVDTYTTSIDFTGGNTGITYTISSDSGTVSGDNPSTATSGTITVTGVNEGTDIVVTVVGGTGSSCDLTRNISSPICRTLPFEESFDYAVGANLGDASDWESNNSGDEILISSGSLSYSGLKTSTGNAVSFDGAGMDPSVAFSIASGTAYASFIFRVTDQTAITDLNDGGYFAVLGNFDARLFVRPNPDASGTTFDVGFGNSGSNPPFTASTFNVGDDIFVVMSYEIGTGNINAWINPASADFEGSAPAATLSGVDGSPTSSINQFLIRQDSGTETPFMLIDELRIGTSWADVTPTGATASVRENNIPGFRMFPNPVADGTLTINTFSNANKQIRIFDILGKQVLSTNLRGRELNVSKLNSGIYILKILEEGKTATRKLVIK